MNHASLWSNSTILIGSLSSGHMQVHVCAYGPYLPRADLQVSNRNPGPITVVAWTSIVRLIFGPNSNHFGFSPYMWLFDYSVTTWLRGCAYEPNLPVTVVVV